MLRAPNDEEQLEALDIMYGFFTAYELRSWI